MLVELLGKVAGNIVGPVVRWLQLPSGDSPFLRCGVIEGQRKRNPRQRSETITSAPSVQLTVASAQEESAPARTRHNIKSQKAAEPELFAILCFIFILKAIFSAMAWKKWGFGLVIRWVAGAVAVGSAGGGTAAGKKAQGKLTAGASAPRKGQA